MKKINLGSHNKRIKGYTNVDALDLPNVDIIHNLTEYPYPFEENSIDEILMVEVLEHISWRQTNNVLKECYRILKPEGVLRIQVPDCGMMMKAYVADMISDEIPHKVQDKKEVIKLQNEKIKLVNPVRWLMAFCGAQKHQYDSHLNVFTKEIMERDLENAGFDNINFIKDDLQWKIIVNAKK